MERSNTRSGFTLIEMLIVITIIGLLAVFLLPNVIGAKDTANQAADQANMRWHFIELSKVYEGNKLPKQGGHKFVLSTWFRGIVEKTETNFNHYWSPGVKVDARKSELGEQNLKDIWPNEQAVTSDDTHYAGRSHQFYKGMQSGNEAWMSNDEEGGRTFNDGTINVLMGDGSVKALKVDPDLMKYGFKLEGDNAFEVGPTSPHPLLQKLLR